MAWPRKPRSYSTNTGKSPREQWLARYEAIVTMAIPEQSGHIDWDTAIFLFNTGVSPHEAAQRTVERLTNS